MFPLRPRPPAFGGKLKRKRAETSGSVDGGPLSQLGEGGAIERAIKDDLDILKNIFKNKLQQISSRGSRVGMNVDRVDHSPIGKSFLVFKTAFQEGKFGALHTRCEPPRSDREAYTQLIYSAALSLFTTSMENLQQQQFSLISCTDNEFLDSSFALFALYTLYETCPLPLVPPIAKEITEAEYDDKALMCLPMGLSSADDSSTTFRRVYKSPIRISRHQYLFIQLLHDVCLLIISQCESGRIRTENVEENRLWICSCSLASDCISIIERLYKNNSFDFSEYSGPLSVEGLAGSEDYFNHIVDPRRSISSAPRRTISPHQEVVNMNEINVSSLESLHSLYHQNLMTLFKSEELLTSRRLQLVHTSLSPILENRRLMPLTDQLNKMVGSLKKILGNGNHSPQIQPQTNESELSTNHGPSARASTLGSIKDTGDSNIANNNHLPFKLVFSPEISTSVQHGAETALKTFVQSANMPSQSITKETNNRGWLWDEISSYDEKEESETEDVQYEDLETEDVVREMPHNNHFKNDDSTNALQRLLSLARYK